MRSGILPADVIDHGRLFVASPSIRSVFSLHLLLNECSVHVTGAQTPLQSEFGPSDKHYHVKPRRRAQGLRRGAYASPTSPYMRLIMLNFHRACCWTSCSVFACDYLRLHAQEDPDSRYTFSSPARDAPETEICREGKDKGRKCISVRPPADGEKTLRRPLLTLTCTTAVHARVSAAHALDQDVRSHAGASALSAAVLSANLRA